MCKVLYAESNKTMSIPALIDIESIATALMSDRNIWTRKLVRRYDHQFFEFLNYSRSSVSLSFDADSHNSPPLLTSSTFSVPTMNAYEGTLLHP